MKGTFDPRIKRGMRATIYNNKNEERKYVFIHKIFPEGKRVEVIFPPTQEIQTFSLRTTGSWVKVDEKTKKAEHKLIFPELIRRDLVLAFGAR